MSDRNLQLQQKSLADRSKDILLGYPLANWSDNLAQLHADFLAQAEELNNENNALRKALVDDQQAKTLITDINLKGGLNMSLTGGFAGVMASIFADQFRGSGATNYLEISFADELGLELTVTLQKKTGKSPHQFRAEAESKEAEDKQQAQHHIMCDGRFPTLCNACIDGTKVSQQSTQPTVKESLTVQAQPSCELSDELLAVQLLSDVFNAWENGVECYSGAEEDSIFIGQAFRLEDETFTKCCELLNRVNPPRNSSPDYEVLRAENERLKADLDNLKKPLQSWVPVVKSGQLKVGDKLKFKIGDKEYRETAKQILNHGTDKEEVIYNMRNNFYFITAMIISGFSNHKFVEVLE
jgi:hypothetical protein